MSTVKETVDSLIDQIDEMLKPHGKSADSLKEEHVTVRENGTAHEYALFATKVVGILDVLHMMGSAE